MSTFAVTGSNGARPDRTPCVGRATRTHPISLRRVRCVRELLSWCRDLAPAGFIASHLVTKLVESGHKVRATVRHELDAPQVACLRELASKHEGKLEICQVTQLEDTAALAKAFQGCDGVFHMAAVHPKYGFAETPESRNELVAIAVEGTLSALKACTEAGIKRVVLTSSLAAVECGNDEGALTESTWSKPEVFDSAEKLEKTTWATHYTYVKSKTGAPPPPRRAPKARERAR